MWFDVQAALKKLEGGLDATSATPATLGAKKSRNLTFVANVASVATLHPSQNTQSETPDIDAFEERAAIAEYDGGLSRADAEHLAAQCQGFKNVVAFRAEQPKPEKQHD